MLVPNYKYKYQYVLYFGEKDIKIAFSKDLKKWTIQNDPVLKGSEGHFDNYPLE